MPLFLHLFIFYTIDTFLNIRLRPISIFSQLSPPWGAEPGFELKPALQQASALPTEPRCTFTLYPEFSLFI